MTDGGNGEQCDDGNNAGGDVCTPECQLCPFGVGDASTVDLGEDVDGIALGDMNGDEMLNILDIVMLSNLILTNDDTNSSGDMNQDGNQNVLDIVMLMNFILDN